MKNKKAMLIISLMTMTMVIFNMAHPVTPKLIFDLKYGAKVFGIVFAAMAATNFITSPLWGVLSDKYGRKRFMVIAPIVYALAQLGFGFSTNLGTIIVFRVLAGAAASATFVAGMAYLIDVTSVKERSKYMAYYAALTGFGISIGYLMGGYIGRNELEYAFIAQASLSVLSALVILLVLSESKITKKTAMKSNIISDFMKYIGTVLPFLLVMVILTSFMFKGFDIAFNAYMVDDLYGLSLQPDQVGIVMAISGLIGLFTNFVVFPFLKRRYDDVKLLTFSIFMIFSTLALATYYLPRQLTTTLGILVVFFMFLYMYRPLIQSIISKVGERNGEIMGLFNAANSVGMVIGSVYIGTALEDISVDFALYSIVVVGIVAFFSFIMMQGKLKSYGK